MEAGAWKTVCSTRAHSLSRETIPGTLTLYPSGSFSFGITLGAAMFAHHSRLILFIENLIEVLEVSVPSASGPRVKRNHGCVCRSHVTDAANEAGCRKVFPHNVWSLHWVPGT